jgi:glycosyltransferase involved in cell wall biosynthesis
VVSLSPNGGKGAALAAGFDKVLSLGAAAAVTLDADGQHAPADLPLFVEAFRQRAADLIIGERDYRAMPPARRIANATGRRLLHAATGWDMPDNQSGYRLLSRRALQLLRPVRSDFAAEVEMIVAAREAGLTVEWIPIRTIYSDERSHFRPIHDTGAFLGLAWRLWRSPSQARRHDGAPV